MSRSIMSNRRNFLKTAALPPTALALGGVSSKLLAQQQSEKPKYGIEGRIAPEIKLDYWIDGDGDRASFSVKESKGKWVFLKFFQNWCPGCHSSGFPTLKAVCDEFYGHEKMAIAGVQTVFEGFDSNTSDAVRELQLRYDIPAVMGHDPGTRETHTPPMSMLNYRSGGTPWLVLIDPEGVVVYNNFHVDKAKLIEFLKGQLT